jgi:hypothetical protein
MSERYDVSGYFYSEQGYNFRSYLNIRRKRQGFRRLIESFISNDEPDLMVVMMNPGSSVPLSGGDDAQSEVSAKPDPTQLQIMKVMDARSFRFARILNLSDLRSPNSADFMSTISLLDQLNIRHSVFGPDREREFEKLYVQSVPVIIAWGADDRLKPLARRALSLMKNKVKVGQRKPSADWIYYHARQRGRPLRLWVEEVLKQL